jgi:hypothetical protein
MIEQGLPVSATDLALEAKLKWMRAQMKKLPKRLRPTATCLTLPEAAQRLQISVAELRRKLLWRRWRGATIDGVGYVSTAQVEMLRRFRPRS